MDEGILIVFPFVDERKKDLSTETFFCALISRGSENTKYEFMMKNFRLIILRRLEIIDCPRRAQQKLLEISSWQRNLNINFPSIQHHHHRVWP